MKMMKDYFPEEVYSEDIEIEDDIQNAQLAVKYKRANRRRNTKLSFKKNNILSRYSTNSEKEKTNNHSTSNRGSHRNWKYSESRKLKSFNYDDEDFLD